MRDELGAVVCISRSCHTAFVHLFINLSICLLDI